jgi:hypothetical protein
LFLGINAAIFDFVDRLQLAVYVFTPSRKLALSMRARGDVLFAEHGPGPPSRFVVEIGTAAGGNGSAKRIGERHRPAPSIGTLGRWLPMILHP